MAFTIALFLTPWANSCSIWPTSRSTWCVFSTAATKTSMAMGPLMRSGVFSRGISIRTFPRRATSLRNGHQFQHVPVRIAKIKAAAAAPIVELAVVETPRRAAEHDLGLFHPPKNGVELAIGDMESEMMTVEISVVVEQQGQVFVYRHRREV